MRALKRLPADTAAGWLSEIRNAWTAFEASSRRNLEAAVALGKVLLQAKADSKHGEFLRLFRDHKDPIAEPLPFNRTWAFKLMRVAEHQVLSDVSHAKHLPADIETVYALSRLPEPALEKAIESGDVHPKMTRREASQLVPRKRSRRTKVKSEDEVFSVCMAEIENAIAAALDLYPELASAIAARLLLIQRGLKK